MKRCCSLFLFWLLSLAPVYAQTGADEYGKDVYWNATPNDVNNLLKSMKQQVDANFHMEVKTLGQVSPDPEQNPVLYRSGHYRFSYTPDERKKLREYLLNGGMIIFNTGLGSSPFYESVMAELKQVFPEQPAQRLTADHPIFHAYYDVNSVAYTPAVAAAGYKGDQPWFDAIEINCRVVALVSRWGMAVGWQGDVKDQYQAYRADSAFQLGVNILTYASAMRAWAKNAAQAMRFVDQPGGSDSIALAQIQYDGVWKTRHSGLSVLLQTFNKRTGVPVKFAKKELKLTDPQIFSVPLMYLTGHEAFTMKPDEIKALRQYLDNGGFLFAEACCGRKGFDESVRKLMRSVYPRQGMKPVPGNSTLFKEPNLIQNVGVTPGLMQDIGKANMAPVLEGIILDGHVAMVYSRFGLSGGWEISQSPYSKGYSDLDAIKMGQNILWFSITR